MCYILNRRYYQTYCSQAKMLINRTDHTVNTNVYTKQRAQELQ